MFLCIKRYVYVQIELYIDSKHKTSFWMLKRRRSVCPHGCFIGNIFVDCTSEEYYYLGTIQLMKKFWHGTKYTYKLDDFITSRHTLWLKGILCINFWLNGNCCFIELNPRRTQFIFWRRTFFSFNSILISNSNI